MSSDAPKILAVDEKPVQASDDVHNSDLTKEDPAIAAQVDDPDVIRRILRKTDLNLITLLGLVGMMSSLDRTNIGNASLTSFPKDLGLVDNQFGAAVSVVYSTYIVFEPIWNVMLKIIGPKILLTCSVASWALLTIGGAFVTNYTQLLVVRLLLGCAEAAVVPGIFMYCSMAYNREEQAVRQSYVTVFSAMAGAFGGLLAFGLTQIQTPSMKGLQWLYLVEGLLSICLVPVVWFRLPNAISEAPWLNDHEKEIMRVRMERNKGVYNKDEQFTWVEVFRAMKDWRIWGQGAMQFGINTTFFALTNFMPRIIAGLGFTSTVNAQLLTVPVYFLSALSFLIGARFSDKLRLRSPFIGTGLFVCLIAYIILAVDSTPVGVRYFALFLLGGSIFNMIMMNVVWASNNHAGYFNRAVATGLVQFVGNAAGAAIGFIFTTYEAPRFRTGMYTAVGLSASSLCITGLLAWTFHRDNKKKRELVDAGALDQPDLGDRNPHFTYYL